MAENLGRVNPVSRHFLDRGAREEPYSGRHSRKHPGPHRAGRSVDQGDCKSEETGETDVKNHIDLRI